MASTMMSAQGAYQLYVDGQFVGNALGNNFSVRDSSTPNILASLDEVLSIEMDLAACVASRPFDEWPWGLSTLQMCAQILFKLASSVHTAQLTA